MLIPGRGLRNALFAGHQEYAEGNVTCR
jgi:hypothetical protein